MRLSLTRVKDGPHEGVVFKQETLEGCSRIQGLEREAEGWGTGGIPELGSYSWNRKESYLTGA